MDAEAKSLHRSTTKQLEAILRERYGLSEAVVVNDLQTVLAEMRQRMEVFEQEVRALRQAHPSLASDTLEPEEREMVEVPEIRNGEVERKRVKKR